MEIQKTLEGISSSNVREIEDYGILNAIVSNKSELSEVISKIELHNISEFDLRNR